MQSAPWAAHLVGVLNHALVAVAFVWVLRRADVTRATAVLAGILFVLSPLTTLATGWMAASFDQLYVLFLLLAAAVIVRLPKDGLSAHTALSVVLATSAALLSKETAVVAPAAVLLLGYLARARDPRSFSWRPLVAALLLVSIPVTAYVLIRAPAIGNSLRGSATGWYLPDLSKIPSNAFRYFVYPFRILIVEPSDGVFGSPWQPAAAGLAHVLLVGAIYRLFGFPFVLAYLAGYFLPLLPVLSLPHPFPHYLYGAGLAMSLAISAVLVRLLAARAWPAASLVAAGIAGLCVHNLTIQTRLHEDGVCQARFLNGVDALLGNGPTTSVSKIHVVPEPGAPAQVAIRAVFARERYSSGSVPLVTFEPLTGDNAASGMPAARRVRMTAACTLVADSVKHE